MTWELNQAAIRGDFLMHHGVKGQRRGRRRYQNEDGSLTPEGREHYGVGEGNGNSNYGNNKFERKFNKDYKNLSKLTQKADKNYQATKEHEYKKQSKIRAVAGLGALGGAIGAESLIPEGLSEIRINDKKEFVSNKIARNFAAIALGTTSAAMFAASLVSGLKATVAGRRTTVYGNMKATQKARAKYEQMSNAYKNTPYEKMLEELKKNSVLRD